MQNKGNASCKVRDLQRLLRKDDIKAWNICQLRGQADNLLA
jgi:hypothetical protein